MNESLTVTLGKPPALRLKQQTARERSIYLYVGRGMCITLSFGWNKANFGESMVGQMKIEEKT